MNYRLRDGISLSCAVCMGLAISSGHPAGIIVAAGMPIPCLMPGSRKRASANAFAYYAAGLWPMIPGVSRFTGHSVLLPVLLWACASMLLSVPWIWRGRPVIGFNICGACLSPKSQQLFRPSGWLVSFRP